MRLISAVLLAVVSLAAVADEWIEMPTVRIGGVKHYLIDGTLGPEAQRFESAEGFCRLRGDDWSAEVVAGPEKLGPLVILENDGAIVATEPNNDAGKYAVITKLYCGYD